MSLTPHQSGVRSCEVQSPDIFSDVRCNLDGQFLNARDSIQAENMCVYARVRPMLADEVAKGYKVCIAAVDDKTIRTVVPMSSLKHKNSRHSEEIDFSFSSAFGPETGQFMFFLETMLPTLQNFVEGGNGLIFSYGITGSGKTYTLQGNSENPGIIPLSLRLYFAAVEKQLLEGISVKPHKFNNIIALSPAEQKEEYRIKQQLLSLYDDECENAPGSFRNSHSKTFAMTLCDLFSDSFKAEERQTTLNPEEMESAQAAAVMKEVIQKSAESQHGICNVWVSFVEIYNENTFDLLTPVTHERKRLLIRECDGNVYIEGAREICVSNGDEALKILNIGRKNLSIASTKMNYQSSRSHCIYTIRVVRVRDANDLSYGKVNRLSFCDLAGSERASKAQTTGIRLKEASSINTSLLVLGRCLEQLRMNQTGRDKRMVPFRDSKLTRLFSGFFMGQGKAVMISNASPCDYTYDETIHVLKFSALAKKLQVNDTFYSEATSTLQSICNEWSNTSSRSLCNESTDSLDSDSDILQKKDEIIEKLLSLAESLTKKEKENADLEMRIRQEVCREYSEYSDQLLEDKRIMYEEQLDAMREIFNKRIAKRDKMYEKIIADLEQRLNETTDDENTFNHSHSIMELDDSGELSPEKILDEKNVDKSDESKSSKLKELESSLESVTAELKKLKEELCESQKSVGNLEKELKICREEKEILSSECATYKNAASKSTEDVKKYETDIKDLEEQLCILKRELNATKELNQSKEFNLHEMESENDMLKKDIHGLKDIIETYEANMDEYKTKIRALEDEVLCNEKNYISAKEDIQIHMNSVSEMKKENRELKSELEMLTEQINKNKEEIKKYISTTKDYESKIHNLEGKLTSNEKHFEEQLQEKLNFTSQLEKEIEKYKSEIRILETKFSETTEKLKKALEKNESKGQDEQMIASLQEKLKIAEEELKKIFLHSTELLSELEVDDQGNATKGQKSYEHVSDCHKLYLSVTKNLKEKVYSLQQEFLIANKNADLIKKEMKVRETVSAELEKENGELKSELEMLTEQINKNKEEIKKYISATKDYESKIHDLEGKLTSNEKHIEEQLQEKLNLTSQLEKEIEKYKSEIRLLETKFSETTEKLKKTLEKNEPKGQDFEHMIASLQEKLTIAEEELKKIFLHSIELLSELEVDDQGNATKGQKSYEHVSDCHKLYLSVTKHLKEKVCSLQQEFLVANKNADLVKKEMKVRETVSAELEKEIDLYKHEIEALKEKMLEKNELEEKCMSLNQELETVKETSRNSEEAIKKEKRHLSERLEIFNKKIKPLVEERDSKIAELKSEIDIYKQNIEALEEKVIEKDELEKKFISLNNELETVKDAYKQISSKLNDIEMSRNSDEVDKKARDVLFEKLEEELSLVQKKLNTAVNNIQEKNSKIAELETARNSDEVDKKARDVLFEKLEEELSLVQKKLNTAVNNIQEKNSKIAELETEKKTYESEIQELKQNQQIIEAELKEKLSSIDIELKNSKVEAQELSLKLCEVQNEKSVYELEIKKVKQNQIVVSELTEKMHLADKELKSAKEEVQILSSKMHELERRKSTSELGTQTLEQNKQIVDLELKDKLQLVSKELKTANEEVQKLSSKICELEKVNNTYELDNKELKKVQKILKQQQEEKLNPAHNEVHLSSDILKTKSTSEFGTQTLKQTEQTVEIEITEKLQLVDKELKTANEKVQKLSLKICELEKEKCTYESEIQKLKQNQEIMETELTEKLHLADRNFKEAKEEIQKLSSKICELEKEKSFYNSEIDKLKQQEEQKISLNEKLLFVTKELETANEDNHQKSSKLHELQNSFNMLKSEIEKIQGEKENLISEKIVLQEKLVVIENEMLILKQDVHQKSTSEQEAESTINTLKLEIEKVEGEKQNLTSEKRALQEKLVGIEREIEILKQDVQERSTNELKIESEICVYKEEINKLKENNANLLSEKLKIEKEVDCFKEKLIKRTSDEPQNKLKELEKEITVYKHDIKKMKDDQKLSEQEKEDLMMVLSTNNEKIDDLEEKITALSEDLNAANDDISTKAVTIEDLENRSAQLCTLLELVENCETKASDKIKELQNSIDTYKSQELNLHNQIKNKENSVEELEKAVLDLQEQVKNVQRSCDNKLVSELEQHETEIVQTIKLKNLVEEENMSLKKQKFNSKLKPSGVKNPGNTTEAVPKKNVNNKGKENIPKMSSSRTRRKKEIDLNEASSSTPIVDRVKSRKRMSDEDFEPSNTRVSKKMKSTEATKIPTRKPSRKKLTENTDAMSPIQKIANSITSKVKGFSSNIPHISSPRLTRGRKKLFNLDAPASSSDSQRVTKGTK